MIDSLFIICYDCWMNIEEKLKNLPSDPGVYLMHDERGEVIYVGKAMVLKNRVRQYFHGGKKDEKVSAMVKLIADFNYIITLSEKDAFALESSLVKKHNPRFNILLKDDKSAPYIRIDLREEFPSIQVVRKVKRDRARYFGPYFGGVRVMDVVAIVRAAYRVRFCKGRFGKRECLNYHINLCLGPCRLLKKGRGKKGELGEGVKVESVQDVVGVDGGGMSLFGLGGENSGGYEGEVLGDNSLNNHNDGFSKEEILLHDTGLELGFDGRICDKTTGSITHSTRKMEYREAVDKAVAFLSGRDDEAGELLEERMRAAAESEDFERAIGYREQLAMIEKMKERHVSSFGNLMDVDSFYLASDGINVAAAVNVVRGGKMMGVRVFYLGEVVMGGLDAVASFVGQYYDGNEIPKRVNLGWGSGLDGGGDADGMLGGVGIVGDGIDGFKEYLSVVKGGAVEVLVPQKGVMVKLVEMAKKNAVEHLNSGADRFKREQDMTIGACERLGKILGVENLRRIECYDVSNMAGEDVVASGVVFVDGRADKSGYRRYKIKTFEGQDDYAAIAEVVGRRFKEGGGLHDGGDGDGKSFPDLVVIDGGKGQLAAAWGVISDRILSHGGSISRITSKNIVGLAKKDEVIHLVGGGEIALAKGDYALRLLMRARDEAHRFANSYNRLLRGGKLGSILEGIVGVGEAKRKKILASISFKEIKGLSAEDIADRAGIDIKTAQNIVEFFKRGR